MHARSVDYKLSWNMGASRVTARVIVHTRTELNKFSSGCSVKVAISGRALSHRSATSVPENYAVASSVNLVARATQVLPFRFVHAKTLERSSAGNYRAKEKQCVNGQGSLLWIATHCGFSGSELELNIPHPYPVMCRSVSRNIARRTCETRRVEPR